MSGEMLVARWTRPARVRGAGDVLAIGVPIVAAVAAVAWRGQGSGLAIGVVVVGIAVLAAVGLRRVSRFDRAWVVRRIDAARGEAEDSADLLFAAEADLTPLQRLQQARLLARLDPGAAADLRPAWPVRAIVAAWSAALTVIAAALLWPAADTPPALAPSEEGVAVIPGVPRLVGQRMRIVPPGYTGLPARYETRLDAKAPVGSRIEWTLRFDPQPGGAVVRINGGNDLALVRTGEDWTARQALTRSILYRVLPQGTTAVPRLHRIEAIADAPPKITVQTPARTLTIAQPGLRRWPLIFLAEDDYGVAARGELRITQAQGEGENITFRERTIGVTGTGPAKRRRFAATLDLGALGFAKGDDLIAQLTVRDTRSPVPQSVRGPSLILRWPPDRLVESDGLNGMAKSILPAYFRSQRQIIIDAEALLKAKPRLAADEFVVRSDTIGVDQRLLRLRYGQFLGQEVEETPQLPTNDAAAPEAHSDDDGHDHGTLAGAPAPTFGSDVNVLADYGHTHDESEAATLLDGDTRATLKQALDQMFQSEMFLRQGDPKGALPFAYKALGLIKQVQQATRIYLPRVGPELPPIDPARRMTGKREGIASRDLAVTARPGDDPTPGVVWRALGEGTGGEGAGDLDRLERWVRANEARVPDPLALAAAIDAVRGDPKCVRCRETLRGLLWRVMPRPAGGVARRDAGDAAARRYLDALR